MRADAAKQKNARTDILMAADEASVNILSPPSLILFVSGIAEDADDIKRYAIICNQKSLSIFKAQIKLLAFHSLTKANITLLKS
jgi:hypothetical protein